MTRWRQRWEGNEEWKRASETPPAARGRESSVGNPRQRFLCDYMFNLLHISKIVCYDRANLQWSPCECKANERKAAMKPLPAASNGISTHPQAGRSRRADSPAIRAGDPLCPNTPRLGPSVIITSLSQGEMPPGWKEGGGGSGEKGRLLQLRPVYLDIY